MNVDKYGNIMQIQPDGSLEGGDSANWTGHYIYLSDLDFQGIAFLFKIYFRCNRLGYVRHPELGFPSSLYYKNPWNGNISRDQLTGILAGVIANKDYLEALKIILHHGAWLWLFSYNTVKNGDDKLRWKWPDFTGPSIWAMELRALGPFAWLLWPILCLLDIEMLLATIGFNYEKAIFSFIEEKGIRKFLNKFGLNIKKWGESNDQINFGLKSIIQIENVPTLTSLLAWALLDREKLLRLIKAYWSGWRDNCDMYVLYERKLK